MKSEAALTSLALVERIILMDISSLQGLLTSVDPSELEEIATCLATLLGGHLTAAHGSEEAALEAVSRWRALALEQA